MDVKIEMKEQDSHYLPVEEKQASSLSQRKLSSREQSGKGSAIANGKNVGRAKIKLRMATKESKSIESPSYNPFTAIYNYKLLQYKSTDKFKDTLHLSSRIAFGVLLAGLVQTRNDYDENAAEPKRWLLLPSFYYLGGLAYAAAGVIFSAGRNLGETIKLTWQAFSGVMIALIFSTVLFGAIPLTQEQLVTTSITTTGKDYSISLRDVYTFIPFLIAYTFVIIMIPMQISTKKFAIGMNIYFVLTIIDPNDPYGDGLKDLTSSTYSVNNIMLNFLIYILVGVVGSCIAILTMILPYPLVAISQLRQETLIVHRDIDELMNVIIDSYCLRSKSVSQNEMVQLRIQRLFTNVKKRAEKMNGLLEFVWWEQAIGLHFVLKFHTVVYRKYVHLVLALVGNLQGMGRAMKLDRDVETHERTMKFLRQSIYDVQVKSALVLREVSNEVHKCSTALQLKNTKRMTAAIEHMLMRYNKKQRDNMRDFKRQDLEFPALTTIATKLFIFSLVSYGDTLVDFEANFNQTHFSANYRTSNFLVKSFASFFNKQNYLPAQFLSALKVTLAIGFALVPAIVVYGFNSTTPSAIAYVMGNYLGGSFCRTSNRVVGVVAGSVIPSIFKFFLCQISNELIQMAASSMLILFWVATSMYVYYNGAQSQYAGTVSAFIAAKILLEPCTSTTSVSGSYGSLVQTSMGMLIFIVVELFIYPKSAITLLRENIQETLDKLSACFLYYYEQQANVTNTPEDDLSLLQAKQLIEVVLPNLLNQQQNLLDEASIEPLLWRPVFSSPKYARVLNESKVLYANVTLLHNVFRWKRRRSEIHHTMPILEEHGDSIAWEYSNGALSDTVMDSFHTLMNLFDESNLYARTDDTAIFLQMKEAFRLADKNCSGTIDSIEITNMFRQLLEQDALVDGEELDQTVKAFMDIVDKDNDGSISFNEFMEAIEGGLNLDVQMPTTSDSMVGAGPSRDRKSSSGTNNSMCWRPHDILNIESSTLEEFSADLVSSYSTWLLGCHDKIAIDDLLLVSCFVSGVRTLIQNLLDLEHITLTE